MSITKTTLLTNIFNEEYLLPFWLHHHKNMFDDIIIVDYNSTDKSIEICKRICPNCTIIKTQNEYFDCILIDVENMNIENKIQGIKMILNTTEFLFCETNVRDIFANDGEGVSYAVTAFSPYSKNTYNIDNNYEFFGNLLNDDVVYHRDRGARQLHTCNNGNYNVGRHTTRNYSIPTNKAHIIWFGYYPMNDNLLQRKLQIQQNIPQHDKDNGAGFQHLYSKEKILSVNNDKSNSGFSLKKINAPLFKLIHSRYKK